MMNRVGKAVFFNLFEAEYEDGLTVLSKSGRESSSSSSGFSKTPVHYEIVHCSNCHCFYNL